MTSENTIKKLLTQNMKYIKVIITTIAAQSINAGCGECSQEDRTINEMCKYFGINRENITYINNSQKKENNPMDNVREKKKIEEITKKGTFERYWITKGNFKSGKYIAICVMVEVEKGIKPDTNYVREITEEECNDMCYKKENKDVFVVDSVEYNSIKYYIRK